MSKKITLVAKTLVAYAGKSYGQNMQFDADPVDAEQLIKDKQAELAPSKREQAAAQRSEPVAGKP